MKHLLSIFSTLLLLVACTPKEEIGTPFKAGQQVSISANGFGNGEQQLPGKKSVSGIDGDEQIDLVWDECDEILVTVEGKSAVFSLETGAGTSSGTFTGIMPADGTSYSVQYPVEYDETVLDRQRYVANGFSKDLIKLSTETPGNLDDGFVMRADYSILGFQLTGNQGVSKLVLTNNATNKTYTLKCAGVTLSNTAMLFYIVVPAGEWEKGFTLDVHDVSLAKINSFVKSDAIILPAGETIVMGEKNLPFVPQYIDLGLSVNWATCNIGATKPEEYGKCFAWGEVESKKQYKWDNYKWCNGDQYTINKYKVGLDNKILLDDDDDVATYLWGGTWRMPTRGEIDELLNNCTYAYITQNGQTGMKFTSLKPGYSNKSIFLPMRSPMLGYWSKSLSQNAQQAYTLFLNAGLADASQIYRFLDLFVRAVTPKMDIGTPFKSGQVVRLEASVTPDGVQVLPGKQSVSGMCEGEKIAFIWDSDDQVLLTVNSENAIFTLASGAKSTNASFVGAMPADGASYSVQYPVNYNESDLDYQTYVPDGFNKGLMKMSTKASGTINDGFRLIADNSILGLQLTGDQIIGKIMLTNNANSKKYTLSCSQVKLDDSTTSFHIVVPTGVWNKGLTVDIYDDNDVKIYTYSVSNSVSFAVGKMVLLPLNNVGILANHDYVDLGLPSGLKWATCNMGASKPEECGDYFAFGETEPKNNYLWSTYKWCEGTENSLTKYCWVAHFGNVDEKSKLDYTDDAAAMNWGGTWRMPTYAEFDELIDNCNWEWIDTNDMQGYMVTGKNGNSIFLPAAGVYAGDQVYYLGSEGYYLSKQLYSDMSVCFLSYLIRFRSDAYTITGHNRCSGLSVRPVCD